MPPTRQELEKAWIKEFFVFGCYLCAHQARSHYDAHNKANDPLEKRLHYANLHTALALSYETLGAILIGMKGWVNSGEFIGHYLAYKQGDAYLNKLLPTMGTVDDLCKNYGIDRAAIAKNQLPSKELDERLRRFVEDTPKIAKQQDIRSTFYNKSKHGTAIVDHEKGPCAFSLTDNNDVRSDLKVDILSYDPAEAKSFYNTCVRIALMMADLVLFHYLSRYDTGYDDLQKALKVHIAIVSITPEP
jgi:hypothetical protein